jgi:uncharacterized protein YecE (DUF72 family)
MKSAHTGTPIHVGTSGWRYKHWRGVVYPEKLPERQMLAFYAERFQTVELNNTFYRLPPLTAVVQWKETTPDNFFFAVKASRYLTHLKKLREPAEGLEKFFDRVDALGEKAGPILFQLPPHWPMDLNRFASFLEALPPDRRYAFEFRDPTWNNQPIYDLLREYKAAYCIFELGGVRSPCEITSNFTYIRLHGPDGKYQGSYDDHSLRQWAKTIADWGLERAYVYFDNDQAGYAMKNAERLKAILDHSNTY